MGLLDTFNSLVFGSGPSESNEVAALTGGALYIVLQNGKLALRYGFSWDIERVPLVLTRLSFTDTLRPTRA